MMSKTFILYSLLMLAGAFLTEGAPPGRFPVNRGVPPQPSRPLVTEEDILKNNTKPNGEMPPAFAELANLPPKEAWYYYRRYFGSPPYSYPDVLWKASLAIANNDAVAEWLDAKIMAAPYNYKNFETGEDINILGTIPAVWSAKLLGKYLYDDRKFEGPPIRQGPIGDDPEFTASPNPPAAAGGLAQMGFSDAPTDNHLEAVDRGARSRQTPLDMWKGWWKANEANIEARILELNPGYKPNSQVAGAYVLPRPTAANTTPTPKLTVTSAPVSIVKSPEPARSDWMFYICAGVILLVAGLVAVASLLRRK